MSSSLDLELQVEVIESELTPAQRIRSWATDDSCQATCIVLVSRAMMKTRYLRRLGLFCPIRPWSVLELPSLLQSVALS